MQKSPFYRLLRWGTERPIWSPTFSSALSSWCFILVRGWSKYVEDDSGSFIEEAVDEEREYGSSIREERVRLLLPRTAISSRPRLPVVSLCGGASILHIVPNTPRGPCRPCSVFPVADVLLDSSFLSHLLPESSIPLHPSLHPPPKQIAFPPFLMLACHPFHGTRYKRPQGAV